MADAPTIDKAGVDIDVELGVTNVMPATSWLNFSGILTQPGTLALSRDPLAPSQAELVFMLRRDGQARAMLNLLTLPIRAAFSQGQWIAPTTGGGDEEAAFANLMWSLPSTAGGMEVSPSMFLNQTLLALAHGFSAFEIVRQVPEKGPLAGLVTIKKMGYRDPRTVTMLSDQYGGFAGFQQQTQFGNRTINATIEPQNAWYWAANEHENPMYGVSFFEAAFQHYQAKRKIYYIWELACQLAAVPGRVGEIPQGASLRNIADFKAALANFAFNTAMVTPPGFKVTPINNNSNFNFGSVVDHHNMMMAASILAKFLQQEDRQVLIDNGKADASADMFVQMLEAVTAELSESWTTKLMPQFIDMNFGTGNYPVHRFAPLTDENKQAIMELFTTIVAQPVLNCTPEFVRTTEEKLAERLGYDIDYNQVAQEEEQAAKEQAEQEQAAAEAQQQGQAQPQGSNLDGTPAIGGAQNSPKPPVPNAPPAAPRTPSAPATAPPAGGSVVKASNEESMNMLYTALSNLFDENEVPEYFNAEPEVIPERGDR